MEKSYTPAGLEVIARNTANRSVVQPGGGDSRSRIGLACASKANRSSQVERRLWFYSKRYSPGLHDCWR
jgi:hypothetical protein